LQLVWTIIIEVEIGTQATPDTLLQGLGREAPTALLTADPLMDLVHEVAYVEIVVVYLVTV
jgi:hypothetical protein